MEEILDELNDKQELLIRFARYFANARKPINPFVTELDVLKLTLKYSEGDTRKEVVIYFDKNKKKVADKIKALDFESKIIDIEVDKSYIPPGRKSTSLDLKVSSSRFEMISMIAFWILILALYFVHLPFFDRTLVVHSIISIVCINASLAIGVFFFGIYTEFPLNELLRWIVHVGLFGFLYGGRFIKIAYRFKEQNDASDDIGVYSSQ